MTLEINTSMVHSTLDFDSAVAGKADQSGGYPGLSQWIISKEELSETRAPDWVAADFILGFQGWDPRGTSMSPTGLKWIAGETSFEESFRPVLEDSSGGFSYAYILVRRSVAESPGRERLDSALSASFDAEPLENGVDHPAEKIIEQALRSEEGHNVPEWLRAFSLDSAQPSFAASVLRCLGRQLDPGTGEWRAELVREALLMEDAEIRDAAVQAAESWEDAGLVDVLASHSEPVKWLQSYIFEVIDDLRN